MTWMKQRSFGIIIVATKIDFIDLPDGELNLIAAALFRELQRRELGEPFL